MVDFIKKTSGLLVLLALFTFTNNVSATRGDEGQQPPEEQSLLQPIASWTTKKIGNINRTLVLKILILLLLIGTTFYYLNIKNQQIKELSETIKTLEYQQQPICLKDLHDSMVRHGLI